MKEMDAEAERLTKLRDRMLKGLKAKLPEIYVNGDLEQRIPGNLNISFAYVEGESLMMGIKDLSVSSGSACTSASLEPSYVLRALGVEEELAHTSLRIGLGRFTTEQEVDYAVEELVRHVQQAARDEPALGDGPGRHRHQVHRVGGPLSRSRPRRNLRRVSWPTAKS